jgi:hypothetical protein
VSFCDAGGCSRTASFGFHGGDFFLGSGVSMVQW